MTRVMANVAMMVLAGAALAACTPQVIYVEAPVAGLAQAPGSAGRARWSGAELRAASSLCGSQDNWVTGLVAMRDAGYQRAEATAWMGSELSSAFEHAQIDSRSEAGGLTIVIAAGVVESVYTEPYGTVDEELASWESACFSWYAESIASVQ